MVTRQRAAVLDQLGREDAFRSAQHIHAELRAGGTRIGLTTVYRALQALAGAGDVDVLRGDDGETTYRLCSTGHHHHLVCRRCGRTVEVESRSVERWAASVAGANGFTDVEHTVEVMGICDRCPS